MTTFNDQESDQLLAAIEKALALASYPQRPTELRGANIDAICFPARFPRHALQASSEGQISLLFAQLASRVGQTKPDH